jgi:hypothetical protein
MRTITEEIKLYNYSELSEKSKLRALSEYVEFESSIFELDKIITQEEFEELLSPLNISKNVNNIEWDLSQCGFICNVDLGIALDSDLVRDITRQIEKLIIDRYNEYFDYDRINEFLLDSDNEYTENGGLF